MSTFIWIDAKGDERPANKMESRYILNVIRMIYNNLTSPGMKTIRYKKYSFRPPHTTEYLCKAFRELLNELNKRNEPETILERTGYELKQGILDRQSRARP